MMIQQCPACQVVIDRPAKFCRQCGMPLPVVTARRPSPVTRGDSRRQARLNTSPTSPASGSKRLSTPTATVTPPPRQPSRSNGNGARLSTRRLLSLIILLLILLGMGSYLIVTNIVQSQRPAENEANPTKIEKRPTPDRLSRPSHGEIEQRRQDAVDAFGNTPNSIPSRPLLDRLGNLVYPGARNDTAFELNESIMLRSTTTDSIDEVSAYYQPIFDSPPLEKMGSKKDETVFSRISDLDTFVVLTREHSREGLVRIVILTARHKARPSSVEQ